MKSAEEEPESSASVRNEVKTNHDAALVSGSLWRAIWTMSWPLLLLMISNAIVGVIDVQLAQLFGASAQAAVGVADQIVFLFIAVILAASIGTNALVSRAFGAGDEEKAIASHGQSLLFVLVAGATLTLISVLSSGNFMRLFTPDTHVAELAKPYLIIYAFYFLPFSFLCIVNAGFRASGDAKTPLFIVVVMTLLNVAGDYWFVYGPMHNLGIKGLAVAGFISSTVGALLAWQKLRSSVLKDSVKRLWPANYPLLLRLIKISVPAALQRMTWTFSVFALFFTLRHCPNPTAALAAWTIGIRVESFLFMPMFALGQAVSSIVGQNLGAHQADRAYRAGWNVSWLGFFIMLVCAIFLFTYASVLANIMTNDPFSLEYTTSYLKIIALAQPLQAMAMIFNGALQGAGDTRVPMWITITMHWLIRQPLAWLLAITCNFGPNGVWTAMSISTCGTGLLCFWRFQSRVWQKLKI